MVAKEEFDRWDRWLSELGLEATFLQTSTWAAINQAVNAAEPHLITVGDGSSYAAGALLSQHAVPGRRVRGVPVRRSSATIRCFGGPVIPRGGGAGALAAVLERTEDLAASAQARQIEFLGPPPAARWAEGESALSVFEDFGYERTPWSTVLVELQRPEQDLLGSFHRSARKAIRKAGDAGVRVVRCEDWEQYRTVFLPPVLGDDPDSDTIGRLRSAWDIDSGRHYSYLAAEDDAGRTLAVLGSFRFNGLATEVMSKRTAAGREAGAPAQDALHWQMLQMHRELGDRCFDLAGFNPSPRDQAEQGIARFKQKWGGRVVSVPQFRRALGSR